VTTFVAHAPQLDGECKQHSCSALILGSLAQLVRAARKAAGKATAGHRACGAQELYQLRVHVSTSFTELGQLEQRSAAVSFAMLGDFTTGLSGVIVIASCATASVACNSLVWASCARQAYAELGSADTARPPGASQSFCLADRQLVAKRSAGNAILCDLGFGSICDTSQSDELPAAPDGWT